MISRIACSRLNWHSAKHWEQMWVFNQKHQAKYNGKGSCDLQVHCFMSAQYLLNKPNKIKYAPLTVTASSISTSFLPCCPCVIILKFEDLNCAQQLRRGGRGSGAVGGEPLPAGVAHHAATHVGGEGPQRDPCRGRIQRGGRWGGAGGAGASSPWSPHAATQPPLHFFRHGQELRVAGG